MGELYHYGVPGMKWGVHKLRDRRDRIISKGREREKQALINDAKRVEANYKNRPAPGTTQSVIGKYEVKKNNRLYIASHIVDDKGKVKLSYLSGKYGEQCIAAGKEYMDKNIDLKQHYRNVKAMKKYIEYDVYK